MTEVLRALEDRERLIVASHVNPDGDSVGASLGLARWIRGRDGETTVVIPGGRPEQFRFLPDIDLVQRDYPREPDRWSIVVLDTAHAERIAAPEGYLDAARMVVNIDHHPGNTRFGDVNLVDEDASSACLLVQELLSEAGARPDPDTATLLYTGVLTDTGAFRFGNTDARTFQAAADLVAAGADAPWVARQVYGEQPLERLRLLGVVLSSLESELGGRVAVMTLTDQMRRDAGASGEDIEGLASYGHLLRDVEVSVLLREQGGDIRASLRSGGAADVNKIAGELGGGGHRAAAGVLLEGPMSRARGVLLEAIARALSRRPA